jgi:DNA-binding NarL/FixJ family response regulator
MTIRYLCETQQEDNTDKIDLTGLRISTDTGNHIAQRNHYIIEDTEDNIVDDITPTELEVLYWAANGLNAKTTAEYIEKSLYNVKKNRQSAMKKLKAHNMTQAVYIACQIGLI